MPILVHIADKKNERRIRDGGVAIGKHSAGVYLMPVLESHFVSHQWIRELKRSGIKNFIGVYVRLSADERVWSGKFNDEHVERSVGDAIEHLRSLDDPLGYELFVTRKIEASEIHRIRHVSPKVGWRYFPGAHGSKPCGCPACIRRGEANSARIRAEWRADQYKQPTFAEVKQQFTKARTRSELDSALVDFAQYKRWNVDPVFLQKALDEGSKQLAQSTAEALASFRHANANRMLLELCQHSSDSVRRVAAESLCHVHREQARSILGTLAEDDAIALVLSETDL